VTGTLVDFRDPAFFADPYPAYARLRADAPVHEIADGLWLVSRYDDVVTVLRGWDRFSSELGYGFTRDEERAGRGMAMMSAMGAGNAMSDVGQVAQSFSGLRILIASDPPDHTILRRLLSKPFAPRQIAALEPRVREICGALIDELLDDAARGSGDLFASISYPLPGTVIAELLGIPTERRADFKRWSDAMDGGFSLTPDRDISSVFEMFMFFNEVVAERRERPRDDLISILVADTGEAAALTTPEIIGFCVLLLVAGNETTTNLIGNLFRALFDRPDQMQRLRDDPSLIPAAVEEALRFDSPVQGLWRGARMDTDVDGVRIREGDLLMTLFASANRDAAKWGDDADAFRVERDASDHVAFGSGVHLCLGASLARLEARIATEMLLAATKELTSAGEPTPTSNPILRGLIRQPVDIIPA
jgi:cytochrome P450